jgi:hypothetical protein
MTGHEGGFRFGGSLGGDVQEDIRTNTQTHQMGQFDRTADEAAAIARVADAAREVQSASKALEERFNEATDDTPPTLPLARLTAAINELQSARDALDALLVRKSLH